MSHIKQNLNNTAKTTVTNFAGPRLAEISEVDHENYTCKCVGLTKTGEKTDVVYPAVPIPKFWASSTGGIFMAPSPETTVLLNFLDNDTNYPVIASIIGSDHSEESKEDTLIITYGDTKLIIEDKKISISADEETQLILEDKKISISTDGETQLVLEDKKISISAGGVNLGDLLKEMADKIADLKTTITTPLTSIVAGGVCAPGGPIAGGTGIISSGSIPLDPGQKIEWKTLKSQKIEKLFK